METENTNIAVEKLEITAEGSSFLITAAQWANFLAILGFVSSGFMVILGLLASTILPLLPFGNTVGKPFSLVGVVYILLGILYFFPAYYLFHFANKVKNAIALLNQELFDESLLNLKKTFKFMGIMAIVVISAYILLIAGMLIFSFSKFGAL